MNDKCCLKCDKHPETGNRFSECPVKTADPWSIYTDYCSRYSPLPDKPGKIEPLVFHSHSDMVDKINELIAVVNRRDK